MNRRDFLRYLSSPAVLTPLGGSLAGAWASPGIGNGRALVVIFLRGGCDGLNVVIPHGDDRYYLARPRIAIAPPSTGGSNAALDLDGFFGLHPALGPLRTSYFQGRLALLPAVHFPSPTRSHFLAQAIVERAGGGAGDGWLNRYLRLHAAPGRGLAINSQLPESLQGSVAVPAFDTPLDRSLSAVASVDSLLRGVLEQAYIGTDGVAGTAQGLWRGAAIDLEATRVRALEVTATEAVYPDGALGRDLGSAAALLREDPDLAVVTISMGGWDTHSNQGGVNGRQATQLRTLAASLAAFEIDLGTRRDDVAVLIQTEFGRTLRENASGGTDHGGASAWMVLSSTLRGGIHFGGRGWPTLDDDRLLDGRALAPTIDFRDVYADILSRHLGCADTSYVLPARPGGPTGLI